MLGWQQSGERAGVVLSPRRRGRAGVLGSAQRLRATLRVRQARGGLSVGPLPYPEHAPLTHTPTRMRAFRRE